MCAGRKVTGALKIVHEKFQKTDLYNTFLEQFSDAVTKNEFIEAHLRKASVSPPPPSLHLFNLAPRGILPLHLLAVG